MEYEYCIKISDSQKIDMVFSVPLHIGDQIVIRDHFYEISMIRHFCYADKNWVNDPYPSGVIHNDTEVSVRKVK